MGLRGPKKGARYRKTLAKEAWEERYRARAAKKFDALVDAQLEVAQGVAHLMAQDPKTKQWTQVTDPDQMVAVLNGAGFHKIQARNPDGNVLRDVFERLCGKPAPQKQQVEHTGHITLEALVAQSRRLNDGSSDD